MHIFSGVYCFAQCMDRAVTGRSTYLRVMVVLGEFSTCGNVCFSVGYGASNFNGESIRQIKVGYRT